ncbi:hypothetical protein GCM10010145_66830 [Streptomyces ruber]|uniref:Uncharacterized protein n=2 Tax=Streptomyces TaxID=1883 RepID=A0A918BSQ4_9ACTN|nr:hypothetical protein [Streptomyces ruber]GGQ88067.1 hypothetical protein GCM10010145_66830 [Streptomyces ruber]
MQLVEQLADGEEADHHLDVGEAAEQVDLAEGVARGAAADVDADAGDIEATTARLSDPAPVFAGGRGCRACFLTTAPTGLRVELVQPREPGTAAEALRYR